MLRYFNVYLKMDRGLMQPPLESLGLRGLLLSICLVFSNLLVMASSSLPKVKCAPGLDTPGVTYPRGDIILEAGSSLEILCLLNATHKHALHRNASHLVFYRNNELVPKEFLQVVNATTLRLFVKEMPASSNMYYCCLKSQKGIKSVCLNSVTVGYKPQEVQNFTCISYNWQNLTCSWVPPHNYIKTTYTLEYRLQGRAGRLIAYGCPGKLDTKENRCFWNASTDPHYRQLYEYYIFTIYGRNVLGNMTAVTIKFHHYAHIKPDEPKDLQVINMTLKSILLRWDVPLPLGNFPPGLIPKIEYQHQWMPRHLWLVANTTNLKKQNDTYEYNLSIEYPHTFYDIRVYLKSAVAIGEDWWSKPASLTHSTMSTIPGAPPKVDVGSFQVDGEGESRDVFIYWQEIPDYMQNGPDFQYAIKEIWENGQLRFLVPNVMTRTYAEFKGLTLNNYRFTVVSKNHEGHSIESSQVYVPSRNDIPGQPESFTKIAFGNGIYELSWKHPNDQDDIVNYTIFWCSNERDRPYQCSGYLNWTYVSSDTRIINITVPEDKIYQFAISANTKSASSGMVWASCTVLYNKPVGKIKNVMKVTEGSTFFILGWKLECSDRIGLVEGYRIYYCPINSLYDHSCKEPEQNTTILSNYLAEAKNGRVTDLKPYTTYKVAVSILTKSGEGLQSDPLLVRTLEEGPSNELWISIAFGILILLLGVVYVCRRLYADFIEMSKFVVQIPDSLKDSVKDKTVPPDDHDRSLKKMGIGGSTDEEKLLNGPEGHGQNPSGGSSGRGSAHESVSSERTSGTQISSDSGADVDRYPTSPDIFKALPGNTPSSLRFRTQSLQSDLTESDHEIRSARDYTLEGSSSPSPSSYLRIVLTDSSSTSKLPPPRGYVTLENMKNPGTSIDALELSCLDDVTPVSSGNYVARPYPWMPKEASLLNPVCTTESAEPTEEVNDFVEAPDSNCQVGWQPGVGNAPENSDSGLFPGRPSISVAEPIRPTASEGYVTVASLGGAGGLPTITDGVRCHSLSESPAPDCGVDSGEGVECSTDIESQASRITSPGYAAIGYFAKDEGIHSANRDVMESLGGASSGETTYQALANEES